MTSPVHRKTCEKFTGRDVLPTAKMFQTGNTVPHSWFTCSWYLIFEKGLKAMSGLALREFKHLHRKSSNAYIFDALLKK